MHKKSLLLSVEGVEESTVNEQFDILYKRLASSGLDIAKYEFPNINSQSSYFIRQNLIQKYGSPRQVGPYVPSLFYALDIYDCAEEIRSDLKLGKIVLCKNYVASTMIKQASYFADADKQLEQFKWLRQLQSEMLNIPKADLSILLAPETPDASQTNIDTKAIHNLHESNTIKSELFVYSNQVSDDTKPIEHLIEECVNQLIKKTHGKDIEQADDTSPKSLSLTASSLLVTDLKRLYKDLKDMGIELEPEGYKDTTISYYTPELKSDIKTVYTSVMDKILSNHKVIVSELIDYLRANSVTPKKKRDAAWRLDIKNQARNTARTVLPVAITSAVKINGTNETISNLAISLASEDYPELVTMSQAIENQLDSRSSAAPKSISQSDKKSSIKYSSAQSNQSLERITTELVGNRMSSDLREVRLTSVSLRNELNIVSNILYENSSLSLEELDDTTASLTYIQKAEILRAYINKIGDPSHLSDQILSSIYYSWDIICDYDTFINLQDSLGESSLCRQNLSPRYGYEIPKLIEEAGLADKYEQCFDHSLDLYSRLQAAGYETEAQYTVLFGHKLRCSFTMNAPGLYNFIKAANSSGQHSKYKSLTSKILDTVKQVHPLIAESVAPL